MWLSDRVGGSGAVVLFFRSLHRQRQPSLKRDNTIDYVDPGFQYMNLLLAPCLFCHTDKMVQYN